MFLLGLRFNSESHYSIWCHRRNKTADRICGSNHRETMAFLYSIIKQLRRKTVDPEIHVTRTKTQAIAWETVEQSSLAWKYSLTFDEESSLEGCEAAWEKPILSTARYNS